MRVLGIDPGIATVGFSVLDYQNNSFLLERCGVITTPAHTSLASRLNLIFEDTGELIRLFMPDAVSVEELFFNNNIIFDICISISDSRFLLSCNIVFLY